MEQQEDTAIRTEMRTEETPMHGATHEVTNVVAPLADYNVFTTDTAPARATASTASSSTPRGTPS